MSIRLWLCPVCGDGHVDIALGTDAHCAGSVVLGTAHEAVAMELVSVERVVPC
jgi:hypothetical protein